MGPHLRVGVDVGARSHSVGIADSEGRILEEFTIPHSQEGFQEFFARIERHRQKGNLPVEVAMEGLNGWGRPLDGMILARGYRLYNVNNLKLARFREIFPGGAKTDKLDVRKILELVKLGDHLPVAKDVLHEVEPVPVENQKLRRLTRRRRQLVAEKVRLVNRMKSDLLAVCPELLGITSKVTNLWFLRFLASRDDLRELAVLSPQEVRAIRGIGKKYAGVIAQWQREAQFSEEAEYVGPMIVVDARRLLEVLGEIARLEEAIEELVASSPLAQRIDSIPGKKHNQAVRALGRHLVRVMWAMLRDDRDYELREDLSRG